MNEETKTVTMPPDLLFPNKEAFAVLSAVASTATKSLDLKELLGQILDQILSFESLSLQHRGGIFLVEKEKQALKLIVERNFSASVMQQCQEVPFGTCLCGSAAATGALIESFDSQQDERHTTRFDGMDSHGHIILPLKSADAVLGVLCLYLDRGQRLTEEEKALFGAISAIIAVRIQSTLNYDEVLRLASYPSQNPNPILEFDAQGRLTYANAPAMKHLKDAGAAAETFLPTSIPQMIAALRESESGVAYFEIELNQVFFGTHIYFLPDSNTLRVYAFDISKTKRAEMALALQREQLQALNEASQALLEKRGTQDIFSDVCRLATKHLGLKMAWLGIVEEGVADVGVVASFGDEQGYLKGLVVKRDDSPEGKGPVGRAIRDKQMVVANDIETDDMFSLWRERALGHGYRACLVIPLIRGGSFILGALALYSDQPHFFTRSRIRNMQAYANQALYAIESSLLNKGLEKVIKERTADLEKASLEYKKLFNAVEQSAETIVVTDTKGKIQYVNPAFENISGYRREEVIGKNPRIVNSGKNPPGFFKQMWEAILKGEVWHGRVINRHKSGDLYYEDMTVSPVVDGTGEIINFIAVKSDVTEKVKQDQALKKKNIELATARDMAEAANRSKSEFLANMSHELRTPLNSIIGFSEIMEQGLSGELSADQKEYMGYILNSGKHLLALINEILDLSKIEAGRIDIKFSTLEVRAVLEDSLKFIHEKTMNHGIKVVVEVADDVDTVVADELRIKQLLVNLLSNAAKFTPDRGTITIRARMIESSSFAVDVAPGAGFLEVSVEDTGPGIRPDQMENLFKPFSQLDSVYEKKHEGTGLGLVISKRIAEAHQGKIWCEAEVGKGSKFLFIIPNEQSPPEAEASDSPDSLEDLNSHLLDPVTKTISWKHFINHIKRVLSYHKRSERQFGLVSVDICSDARGVNPDIFIKEFRETLREHDMFAFGEKPGSFYLALFESNNEKVRGMTNRLERYAKERGCCCEIKAVVYPDDGVDIQELFGLLQSASQKTEVGREHEDFSH